jgi:hypothetical protein
MKTEFWNRNLWQYLFYLIGKDSLSYSETQHLNFLESMLQHNGEK